MITLLFGSPVLVATKKRKLFDILSKKYSVDIFCEMQDKFQNKKFENIQDKRSSEGILKIVHLKNGQNRC